ncbi:MAG: MFS transporter [Acidimicrobiales bacterium]
MRVPPSRNFRTLIGASVASQLGDWAARLALSLLVYERTGDPSTVGLVATILVLPWLGPGQWLAAWSDRLDRRRLLMGCDIVRGAVFVAIGFVNLPLPVLLPMIALAATIDPVFEANRSALIVDIVPEDDYPAAIQVAGAINQASQLIGFSLGGVLSALLSPSGALALNGASFLLSALLISHIRVTSTTDRSTTSPSLSQAYRFLADDPLSRTAVIVTFLTVAAAMAVESQAVVYGSAVVGLDDVGTGLLAAIVPAATLLSIMDLRTDGDDREVLEQGLFLAVAAAIPAAILLGGGFNRASAFVGYAAVGLIFTFSTAANIAVGRRIPAESRAGTFGVLQAMVFLATSLGAALGGVGADLVGSKQAAAIAMLVTAASSLAGVTLLRSRKVSEHEWSHLV